MLQKLLDVFHQGEKSHSTKCIINKINREDCQAQLHLEAIQTVHFLGLKHVTNSMDDGVSKWIKLYEGKDKLWPPFYKVKVKSQIYAKVAFFPSNFFLREGGKIKLNY